MTDFIIQWLVLMITLGIGYYLGARRQPSKDIPLIAKRASARLDQVIQEAPLTAGAIIRPSARELSLRDQPQHIKDAKDSVKETLDQVPELQEAKAHVDKLKAEGSWIP